MFENKILAPILVLMAICLVTIAVVITFNNLYKSSPSKDPSFKKNNVKNILLIVADDLGKKKKTINSIRTKQLI